MNILFPTTEIAYVETNQRTKRNAELHSASHVQSGSLQVLYQTNAEEKAACFRSFKFDMYISNYVIEFKSQFQTKYLKARLT